ncbi:hypothetical protein AKJ57_00895 [candidate division MSBL1 archaeon SCGC-AAA259A05]|nr:hypothetical protein AKJ57_00895 [candidate division MSBL1 archaeon SCGC-AAA259A05]
MKTINFFRFGNIYYFKHYFRSREIFEELRSYYDSYEYRFKVKEEDLDYVLEKLKSYDYEINFVDEEEISDYAVIINKYEKHADLLKRAVDTIEIGDEKALVMKDKDSKEEALTLGKEPDDEWEARL